MSAIVVYNINYYTYRIQLLNTKITDIRIKALVERCIYAS